MMGNCNRRRAAIPGDGSYANRSWATKPVNLSGGSPSPQVRRVMMCPHLSPSSVDTEPSQRNYPWLHFGTISVYLYHCVDLKRQVTVIISCESFKAAHQLAYPKKSQRIYFYKIGNKFMLSLNNDIWVLCERSNFGCAAPTSLSIYRATVKMNRIECLENYQSLRFTLAD